jgi:hypothetical protein
VSVAIYLPFFLAARQQFLFNILGLNLSLHGRNAVASLAQKARSLAHLARNLLFPLLALMGAILLQPLRPRTWWRSLARPSERVFLWAWVLSITAGHLGAKIFQESYQSFLYPLLAALIAVELSRGVAGTAADRAARRTLAVTFGLGCMLMALAYGRESLSHIDGRLPTRVLAEQAELARSLTTSADRVFSADTALVAVCAGRTLLPGMAGSDYFPGWDSDRCRRYHVTNDEILTAYLLQRQAKLLIVGDASFTLSLPLLEPVPESQRQKLYGLIEENYELVREYPNLMVPGARTRFYVRRDEPRNTGVPGAEAQRQSGGPEQRGVETQRDGGEPPSAGDE